MAHPGEDHGDIVFVGRIDHFLVPHRAARLDDGANARLRGRVAQLRLGARIFASYRETLVEAV